jgi:hypothetical protein
VYNNTTNVAEGHSTWTSYEPNETLPRYMEYESPRFTSPNTDNGGGHEVGHSDPA